MRQQRTSRLRLQTLPQVPSTLPDLQWRVVSIFGVNVQMEVQGLALGSSINGVPQVYCDSLTAVPVDAVLSVDTVTLEYGSAPALNSIFTWPSREPAVRNQQGQFVAGWTQPNYQYQPLLEWTAHITAMTEVVITLPTADFSVLMESPMEWRSLPSATVPFAAVISGQNITLSMAADISADTEFQFFGSQNRTIDLSSNRIHATTVPLT